MGSAFSQSSGNSSSLGGSDITIAVIGRRGVGKSVFINTAVQKDAFTVGRAAERVRNVELVPTENDLPPLGRCKIVFMEVPPFETSIEEEDYPRKLRRWLGKISSTGVRISGILYLHPITDPKTPSNTSWLRALYNHASKGQTIPVVLVTTMWGILRSKEVGEDREQVIKRYWNSDLAVGHIVTQVMKFNDTSSCAWSIVSALLNDTLVPIISEKISKERTLLDLLVDNAAFAKKPPTPSPTPPRIERQSISEKLRPSSEEPKDSTSLQSSDLEQKQGKPSKVPKSVTRRHSTNFSDSQAHVRRLILEIIKDPGQAAKVVALRGQDAQDVVDFLSELLHEKDDIINSEGRRILTLLCDLAKATKAIPKCYELKGIDPKNLGPIEGTGGFADVYKQIYKNQMICLKVVRRHLREEAQNIRFLKSHIKELILWSHLRHENILPFYGAYILEDTTRLCIVSPWMENGDLHRYLKNFPKSPRFHFASNIVSGLSYLHQRKIIHGDLKAVNVLVSADKRALIADFGLSRVAMDSLILSTRLSGTMSWTAPELLAAEDLELPPPREESDVWSLGCVLYEVFTRKFPFYQYSGSQWAILIAITMRRETPRRPDATDLADVELDKIDDRTWDLIAKCWEQDPKRRVHLCDLLGSLMIQSTHARPTSAGQMLEGNSAFWKVMQVKSQTTIDYAQVFRILQRVSTDNSDARQISDFVIVKAD